MPTGTMHNDGSRDWGALDGGIGADDLEQRLARLERRYAEATMRYRRARDEYHLLCLQPLQLEAAIARARTRYESAHAARESLRSEIEQLEARLD
jgi:chromosome segregation ATPase